MKAQLVTILNTGPEFRASGGLLLRSPANHVKTIELPDDYDGDPYGDKVPFPVGSNQYIRTDPDDFTPDTD